MTLSVSLRWMILAAVALCVPVCLTGCGTTRMSNTNRTATEQLLISTAVDQAIDAIDFDALADKEVYLDTQQLKDITDVQYIVSSLRHHLLAAGAVLKDSRETADYIVEPRAGAVGTNQNEVMVGIRSISIPSMVPMAGSTMLPEIPFAKTTDQKGVAKIAVFAYNRHTGRPVWQSGTYQVVTSAKDTWFFGTGPFQRGSIYDGTRFAGSRMLLPFSKDPKRELPQGSRQTISDAAVFPESALANSASASSLSKTTDTSASSATSPKAVDVQQIRATEPLPPATGLSSNVTTATYSGSVSQALPGSSSSNVVDGMSGLNHVPSASMMRLPPLDRTAK